MFNRKRRDALQREDSTTVTPACLARTCSGLKPRCHDANAFLSGKHITVKSSPLPSPPNSVDCLFQEGNVTSLTWRILALVPKASALEHSFKPSACGWLASPQLVSDGPLLPCPLERGSAGREAAAQGTAAAPRDPEHGLQQSDPDAAEAERLPAGAQHHAADPDSHAAGG